MKLIILRLLIGAFFSRISFFRGPVVKAWASAAREEKKTRKENRKWNFVTRETFRLGSLVVQGTGVHARICHDVVFCFLVCYDTLFGVPITISLCVSICRLHETARLGLQRGWI